MCILIFEYTFTNDTLDCLKDKHRRTSFSVSRVCVILVFVEFPALDHIGTKTQPYRQAATVRELVKRLIGARSVDFDVEVDPSIGPKNRDTFKVITHPRFNHSF